MTTPAAHPSFLRGRLLLLHRGREGGKNVGGLLLPNLGVLDAVWDRVAVASCQRRRGGRDIQDVVRCKKRGGNTRNQSFGNLRFGWGVWMICASRDRLARFWAAG